MTTLQCLVSFAGLSVLASWVVLATVALSGPPRIDEKPGAIGQLPDILFPSQN